MRAVVVLVSVLAGCGFQGTAGNSGAIDAGDGPRTPDAPLEAGACTTGPDGDGDGKVDDCDPCPLDNPDDPDGDGVCTTADLCTAGNDTDDADSDSVPDACDDWPCGAKPPSPGSTVMWVTPSENVTLSGIDVATQGQLIVATPGQVLAVTATFSIIDCQCAGCIDQIEIGFIPGGKDTCLYSGNPAGNGNCLIPTVGAQTRNVTAPTTAGTYDLRFNRGNDNSCQANGVWWDNSPPGTGNTFAKLCVH